MALHVDEIMNHEPFSLSPLETVANALRYFSVLKIAAAPVVDGTAKPLGFVSVRDLIDANAQERVERHMTRPADTVGVRTSIKTAAQTMVACNRHHLPVVDDGGRVVGYVGSLDMIRGLLDLSVPHPPTFPHYDATAAVSWSDDLALIDDNIPRAPDGPGLLRVVQPRTGERDRVVLSEATHNVRTRLVDILSTPQPRLAAVADDLSAGRLRFRAASTDGPDAFAGAAAAIGLHKLSSTRKAD